ncbi:FtsP/CotA-like multicopper oxidase with cupredoxin domain [Litoreibacter halocynthiae]|uniref:FtsP/CotA-like multicopper oxidase with cupredoxin domain n=1 Tax=Litoreibacter halocynthiae TaxID=1242689 RepID=A0A4V3EVE6_9RHOB|nr:multicopper oxidase family protein [Litoreibacter halocynthiae]TDT72715.1 FtsP/CotA-like multicopper oxidase with cupredoxin domain [Litoreibacter halocynthiae]
MAMNRRSFLLTSVASMLPLPLHAGGTRITLRPGQVSAHINQQSIDMLGFNGSWPGPEIRLRQNDRLRVRVVNELENGTILHWHGIRLPNAMDGVNVLTQDAIPPGRSFDYDFKVPDAGTFWYHSHYMSVEQVSRGMFGPLIVEEIDPPDVDQDITVMLFDVLLDADGQFETEFEPEQFATAGRIGNIMTPFVSTGKVRLGERLRLRVINPAPDRIFNIRLDGVNGKIVALDGMPLTQLQPMENLTLAPGQRVDIIGDVLGNVSIIESTDTDETELVRIPIDGERKPREGEVLPLPKSSLPRPGLVTYEADLEMQGGAGGMAHGGFGTWAFNDTSGLPDKPLVSVPRGDTVRLRLINNTAFPHGIHLHGHHFWETTTDGKPTYLRDTTLLAAGETREILCVLDNPGSWLLHCHMLSHQVDGMATWLYVS